MIFIPSADRYPNDIGHNDTPQTIDEDGFSGWQSYFRRVLEEAADYLDICAYRAWLASAPANQAESRTSVASHTYALSALRSAIIIAC